jgi:hypothetical protein
MLHAIPLPAKDRLRPKPLAKTANGTLRVLAISSVSVIKNPPNAKRQTPNAKRQTPNAKRQTPRP